MNQGRNVRFIQKRPYFVPLEATAAAGATVTLNQATIIGDLNFIWTHLGAKTAGGERFEIEIRDVGGNVDMQSARFDIETVVGDENIPFELPIRWLFLSKSGVNLTVTNQGTVQDTLYLTLIGYLDPSEQLDEDFLG